MASTDIHTKNHKNDFEPQIYGIYDELRVKKETTLCSCFSFEIRTLSIIILF